MKIEVHRDAVQINIINNNNDIIIIITKISKSYLNTMTMVKKMEIMINWIVQK